MSTSPHQVVPIRAAVPVGSVQGTLALDLAPRHDPPPTGPDADVIPIDQAARRDVERWARRYAQAAVEIVGGDRPVSQLLRWSTRQVYDDLARRASLVARAGGHQPGAGRVQPVRPMVVGARSCFLAQDAVEVGVHVRYGPRSRAVALRFEHRRGRWLCAALDFA